MFPEWHHAVPGSAYFKVPETLKTFRMYQDCAQMHLHLQMQNHYEGVGLMFNVISVTRGSVGVQFPEQ